jgi:hypothetical protein
VDAVSWLPFRWRLDLSLYVYGIGMIPIRKPLFDAHAACVRMGQQCMTTVQVVWLPCTSVLRSRSWLLHFCIRISLQIGEGGHGRDGLPGRCLVPCPGLPAVRSNLIQRIASRLNVMQEGGSIDPPDPTARRVNKSTFDNSIIIVYICR